MVVLLVLLIVGLSAIAAKLPPVPYMTGLVAMGLGLGILAQNNEQWALLQPFIALPPRAFLLFVPLFIARLAFNIEGRLLMQYLSPVLLLGILGVFLSTVMVGGFLVAFAPLAASGAILLGILLSVVDLTPAIALLQKEGCSKRLQLVWRGESLGNNVTAIVLFTVVAQTLSSGSYGGGIGQFFASWPIGIILGGIAAGLASYGMQRWRENFILQGTMGAIALYGAFLGAERLYPGAGAIAAMTVGLVLQWTLSTRLRHKNFQRLTGMVQGMGILAQSWLFLLLGLTLAGLPRQVYGSSRAWLCLGGAIAIVTIARGSMVFALMPVANFLRDSTPFSFREQLVGLWGGMRGSVALALVLSWDTEASDRNLAIFITLGVTLALGLASEGTMVQFWQRLGLTPPALAAQLQAATAELAAKRDTLEGLFDLGDIESLSRPAIECVKQEYREEVYHAEDKLARLWTETRLEPGLFQQTLWLQALAMEETGYRQFYEDGLLSELAFVKLELRMHLKRDAVLAGFIPPPFYLLRGNDTKIQQGFALFLGAIAFQPAFALGQADRVSTAKYEADGAIAYTCKQVALNFHRLVEDSGLGLMVAKSCAKVYEEDSLVAWQSLEAIASRNPDFATRKQQEAIRRTIHFLDEF
ncbi:MULTISPECIES: cation:proton antiporter [Spirulina sp. CCY15215]|uniref:cation:proton antiporter domain-containing protein n=1 Tax=Spirulina sp. CCY15215 TaxID=2767591 RepID=UPI0019529129|nr:cation:proton antiporter [Spirulina major]